MKFIIISILSTMVLVLIVKRILLWSEMKKGQGITLPVTFWTLLMAIPAIAVFIRFQEFDMASLLHFLPYSGFLKTTFVMQFVVTLALWLSLEISISGLKNKTSL